MTEKAKIYIKDLLSENNKLLVKREKCYEQIKRLKNRLLENADLVGALIHQHSAKEVIVDISNNSASIYVRLVQEVALYYDLSAYIEKNLDKVEGLRNGSIKEI